MVTVDSTLRSRNDTIFCQASSPRNSKTAFVSTPGYATRSDTQPLNERRLGSSRAWSVRFAPASTGLLRCPCGKRVVTTEPAVRARRKFRDYNLCYIVGADYETSGHGLSFNLGFKVIERLHLPSETLFTYNPIEPNPSGWIATHNNRTVIIYAFYFTKMSSPLSTFP